jgi:hypothetical protein
VLPEAARRHLEARVVGCIDIGQLRTWVRRAVTAESIDEVFA